MNENNNTKNTYLLIKQSHHKNRKSVHYWRKNLTCQTSHTDFPSQFEYRIHLTKRSKKW